MAGANKNLNGVYGRNRQIIENEEDYLLQHLSEIITKKVKEKYPDLTDSESQLAESIIEEEAASMGSAIVEYEKVDMKDPSQLVKEVTQTTLEKSSQDHTMGEEDELSGKEEEWNFDKEMALEDDRIELDWGEGEEEPEVVCLGNKLIA